MAAYVLKGLRVLGFLTLFFISSKIYFFIYGDTAILNGNTAFQVAGFFNNNPTPEDVYAISDYAVLVINIIVAIVVYSVGMNLIQIKSLVGKGFSQHIASIAKGIALRILKVVSVIGPSGSGKTTLIRLLNGLEQIDNGEIRINGQPFIPDPETAL